MYTKKNTEMDAGPNEMVVAVSTTAGGHTGKALPAGSAINSSCSIISPKQILVSF